MNDCTPTGKALFVYTTLLANSGYISLTDLSKQLGTTKQSVLRAILSLEKSRFGKVEVMKKSGQNYYRLQKPDSKQARISLDVEGLRQLALCRDLLFGILPDSILKKLDLTLKTSEAYLPSGQQSGNEISLASTLTKGAIDYSGCDEQLNGILEAIRKQCVCQVTYKAGLNREAREYCYAPKRLVSYHDAFFVHGWVVTDKGTPVKKHDNVTVLSLQRILKVSIEWKRSSSKLPEIEVDDSTFGMIRGEETTVVIRFEPEVATYVAERHWSDGQTTELHGDGSLTLTMKSTSPQEVVAWVLGFGQMAKVLEPAEIATKVAEQGRKIAELYQPA